MSATEASKTKVAFIAKGELFLFNEGAKPQPVTSTFMQEAEKRDAKGRAVNGWKENTTMWGDGWGAPQLKQFQTAGSQRKKLSFTNVARDQRANIAFSLGLPGGAGLFRYDCQQRIETRLMHRNSFFPSGLCARDRDGLLAFSVAEEDGSSSIVVGERDALHHRRITAGDSRDESPCWWNDGTHDWLYFHSSGVGRTVDGIAVGFGPASICRVRLDHGDVETVAESETYDYLQPRVLPDGTLLCIRRPYEPLRKPAADPVTLLKDIVFFPFRLARAAFYFANFISVMFSGRPLASQELKPAEAEQLEGLVLWGKMVDTQRAIKEAGRSGQQRLAPSDWQLVRFKPNSQTPDVLSSGVLCFDIGQDGGIFYSDGGSLYRWTESENQPLLKQYGIIQVAALC